MFLTKNDFLLARECPPKLFYKKMQYPSLLDDDPYLEFLRDGGYMVEKIAKLLFPEGRELGSWTEPQRAFDETSHALADGNGTLFEATVIHGNLLARIDILKREQEVLRVIEVKSSSFDSRERPMPFRGEKGGILSEWREHLEDVTFQVVVLQRAFPKYKIVPILCLVDKAKLATSHTTFDKFKLTKGDKTVKPRVDYVGDPALLIANHQLGFIDAAAEVNELMSTVSAAADEIANSLRPTPILRIRSEIGKKCKACEYRISAKDGCKDGFGECWGVLGKLEPHVLDLYRVDSLGGKKNDVVATMAKAGKAYLDDVDDSVLQGAYANRQRLQIECTRNNREFISPQLSVLLQGHPYPLHFIDFEVSRAAVAYRAGMRAYELAAFQWSCETVAVPEGEVVHKEWINSEDAVPNFAFARSLRAHIGNSGTVYIWSPFEISTLREIRQQMLHYGENDPDLATWLDQITTKDNPRIVDLCALAKDHYFHPIMKSSLSIKNVLAAAWATNQDLRANPLFKKYDKRDKDGTVMAPYKTLPPLPIGEKEEVVNEGTGAMRVYQEMTFGRAKENAALLESYKALLLQYCELDTKAMVFIWMHWQQRS
jgi:hypothetical protein